MPKSVLSRTFLVFYCVYFVPFQNVLIFEIQRWLSVEVVVTLSVLAGPPTESDRQSKNHQILWNSNIIAVSLLKIYKNFKTWEHIVETVWKIWEWRLTERDQNLYNHYWSSPDPWTKNLPGSIHLVKALCRLISDCCRVANQFISFFVNWLATVVNHKSH